MHPFRRPRLVSTLVLLATCQGLLAQDPPTNLTAQGPVEEISVTRAKINLNGLWKFQPAADAAAAKPIESDWGTIWVPGTWGRGSHRLGTIQDKGTGEAWKIPGEELVAGWYERTVEIPANWAGRAILLDLRRVSTDAEVWVNNTACGTISWPFGHVDVSSAVTPGEPARLRLIVIATPDDGEIVNFMGYATESTSEAKLHSAGIIGEVFLESRPSGAHISDVFVQTSTRKGELALDVELAGIDSAGEVQFTASVVDASGVEVKSLTQTVPVQATATQVVEMAWPWAEAKRWDLDQPNIYTLKLTAIGPGLNDQSSTRFGFREVWIEGREIYLNGTPLRLRPVLLQSDRTQIATMDPQLKALRDVGFNIVQIWPENSYERGKSYFWDLWAERADEKGVPMIHVAQSANRFIQDSKFQPIWDRSREKYHAIMESEMRRLRNHPSILIWGTSGNLSNHGSDQNPRFIGQKAKLLALAPLPPGLVEALEFIKEADPTRPVFAHAGNRAGDLFTANHYLNFIPLQEREEWMSDYAKSGDVPYTAIEFGTPLNCSWMRGRAGYGPTISSEPWATEFAAIYGGPEVYASEPRDYRRALRFSMTSPGKWGGANWERLLNAPKAVQDMQSLFTRNTWRSWRTAGVTGGMVPWNAFNQFWAPRGAPEEVPQPAFEPGFRGVWKATLPAGELGFLKTRWETLPSGKVLEEVNGDFLAWIAGPPDHFTKKDKSFRPGDKIDKQAVLINDSRSAVNYSLEWTATLGGEAIANGDSKGKLEPGRPIFLPIAFSAPDKPAATKMDGEISITAQIGDRTLTDTFPFRVFPPAAPLPLAVLAFDPAGKTTAFLKSLGVSTKPWDGKPSRSLLVVGREALSSMAELPGDLQAFTSAGGRVLIMTQSPEWLRTAMGFRVSRHATRRVFPVDSNHPALTGLDARDLSDWNGRTTLSEPYPEEPNLDRVPIYGWKWGNQGVVASAAIEKPHRSGWRPLLESDFDLAYSPLMELDFGKGRVTLCTLDLEDQAGADPVADQLARQLLSYVATAPLSVRPAKTVFLGGPETEKLIADLAVVATSATTLDPQALNVLGPDAAVDATALERFVKAGGRIVELARPKGGDFRGLKIKVATGYRGAVEAPVDPLFAGLSGSDLRLRTEVDYRVIDSGAGAEVFANGLLALRRAANGFALATQIDPTSLDAVEVPALRFSRWRQTRALAQILANCGATFATDERIFQPRILSIPLALPTWKAQLTIKGPPAADDQAGAKPDPGISPAAQKLVLPDADETGMELLALPARYVGFDEGTGEAVFRLTVDLPAAWAGKILSLELGPIADFDTTFFNGVKVGGLDAGTKDFNTIERKYRIPGNLVKAGRNVIAVRVWDQAFGPGIYGRPNLLRLRLLTSEKPPASYYSSDYVETFEFGDEPYRYYRW